MKSKSMPDSSVEGDLTALLIPPAAEAEGLGGRTKRVYGKRRTILVQASTEITEMNADGDGVENQESYAELRRRYEVDNDTASGSGSLMTVSTFLDSAYGKEFLLARAPQAVSDMRSKGENRRFMDEIAYLTDGISGTSQSFNLKRTRYVSSTVSCLHSARLI